MNGLRSCCALWLIFMLAACATLVTPVPTPNPSTTIAPSPASTANVGYLAGRVSVGPLRPVERVGVTPPPVPPEVYTARSLNVFQSDGKTLVKNVAFNGDGTYRAELPAGTYVVDLKRTGIDRARGLPQTITITRGQTTTLDVDIDTGIR